MKGNVSMITLKDWLEENDFDINDIKNQDIKVYDENYNNVYIYDLADADDYEVLDSYLEEGIWKVIVEDLNK